MNMRQSGAFDAKRQNVEDGETDMPSEKSQTDSESPSAPAVKAADPWASTQLRAQLENSGTIFDRLVSDDGDVIGLLSYSLAMQNKRDWLASFVAAKGRPPNNDEIEAYEIGESIDRRLTTYRKLAENALAGNPLWASTGTTPVSELLPAAPATGPFPGEAPSARPALVLPQLASSKAGHRVAIAGGVFAVALVVAYAARYVM